MGSSDGSSTDYGSSDFDSDTGSRVSSMSATSANEEQFMIDHEPLHEKDMDVDLTAFHDCCRKILAKPLPPNASTGKISIIETIVYCSFYVKLDNLGTVLWTLIASNLNFKMLKDRQSTLF